MSYRTWARLCAVLATAAALLAPIPMAGQGDGADSRPWTVEMPWIQAGEADNQIFESACHEGNYGLTGILAGARAIERGGSE